MELALHPRIERSMVHALEAVPLRDFCLMDQLFVSLNVFFSRHNCTLRVRLGIMEAILD